MNFFRKHGKKIGLIFGGILLFYTILGFFGVPYFIKNLLPNLLSQKANLTVKEAKFNPFLFELNLQDLNLQTNKPLFSAKAIELELNPKSLFARDILVKNLTLTSPNTQIYRDKNGRFNFDSFLSDDEISKDEDESSFFNFILENFKITNGSALYSDESLFKPFVAKFENLNYEIKNLNLGKNSIGSHTLNSNSALVKSVKHSAKIGLNPFEINGTLEILGLDASQIWKSFVDIKDLNLTKALLDAKIPYVLNVENGLNLKIQNANLNAQNIEFLEFSDILNSDNIAVENANLNLSFKEILKLNLEIDKILLPNFEYKNPNFGVKSENNEFSKTKLDLDFENNRTNLRVENDTISHKNIEFNFQKNDFIKSADLAMKGTKFILNDSNFSVSLNSANIGETSVFAGSDNFSGFKNAGAENIEFDIDKLSLKIANSLVDSPKFISHIGENGVKSINSLALIKFAKSSTKSDKTTADDKNATKNKEKSDDGFKFEIANAQIKNGFAKITESFVVPNFAHEISNINANAKNINSNYAVPFSVQSAINSNWLTLSSDGKITINPLNINVNFGLNLPNLEYFNPYVSEFLNAKLSGGSHKLEGNFSMQDSFVLNGKARLENSALLGASGDKIFSLKELEIGKIALTQNSLNLENISLNSPFSKILISKNKKLNLANLIKQNKSSDKNATKEPKTAKNSEFDINLKRINIKNGRVNFIDQSLFMPFDFVLSKIDTSIDEIGKKRPTKLKFRGNIGKNGFGQIDLTTLPFSYEKRTNLSLVTKGVLLSEATPYSAKYLGRKIDDGKLNLNLNYAIKNSQLSAANDINLDNLTLGESVQSEDAINLPLDLAISILKDTKGQINVNLPVGGDIKDPKFSYGGVIWSAVLKLFSDIALSPFRLIGSVLGIDTNGLESIDFNGGEDEILASENAKLENLAKIAKEKPEIKLILTPTFSEKADGFAFKKKIFDREIANLMQDSDLSYENATANLGQKLRVKKSEDSENYENAVIEMIKFDTSRLEKLAIKRGEIVKNRLKNLGVSENQIELKSPENSEPKQDIFVPLKLGLKN